MRRLQTIGLLSLLAFSIYLVAWGVSWVLPTDSGPVVFGRIDGTTFETHPLRSPGLPPTIEDLDVRSAVGALVVGSAVTLLMINTLWRSREHGRVE
jgi:hypothetical protein